MSCVPNRVHNYGALILAWALLSQIVHRRLYLVTMFVFFQPPRPLRLRLLFLYK